MQAPHRQAQALLHLVAAHPNEARLDADADLQEAHVAFWMPAGLGYVTTLWGTWRSRGVAVPLSLHAPLVELEYFLTDAQAHILVTTRQRVEQLQYLPKKLGLGIPMVGDDTTSSVDNSNAPLRPLRTIASSRRAMILYTSGTSWKPKGVVTTHQNIQAQIETLVHAWQWQPQDCIPLFLHLHHVHGIINVLSCALWTGATVDPFARGFDMDAILHRVAEKAYTVFMAVPTIYVKLICRRNRMMRHHENNYNPF